MLEPGRLLAHYRLTEKIGQGGMGVVWKGTDTKLDREVAIKLLPEQFADDPERLGRFEREAKLLASLNHRNIASIYGHEESGGLRFLVMELVEGEDLAQRLVRGPLPMEEALDVCHQLARALESAHDKGILHRDLKPANVRITPAGRVKVLDFGLAKAFETKPLLEGDPALSPTLTSVETKAGIILGTAAYMSPEQARGKPLDKRTDIWAFGCLLYECLTGKSPFHGETVTDTLASIVKTQADDSLLPAETPPRIRELLQRCLEKDVRNRLRDIGEARIELQRALGTTSVSDSNVSVTAPLPALPRRFSTGWLAAATLFGAMAGVGLWIGLGPGGSSAPVGDARVVRFSVVLPPELEALRWQLSPEGRTIAYAARRREGSGDRRLYVRSLDTLEARPVEASDGLNGFTFSPDGRWLALVAPVAPRSTKRRLLKVPVDGGAPALALLDWGDDWSIPPLWLPDGDLVVQVGDEKSLVRIPSEGGAPGTPLEFRFEGYEGSFRLSTDPRAVFPDGVHVLGEATTYSETGYDNSVALLNLETGQTRMLIENGASPTLSPTGHLVFSRGDTVLATAFDQKRMEPVGNTVAVQAGMRALAGYGDTDFDLSGDGTFLHWPGGVYGDKRQLVFVDRVEGGGFEMGSPWSDDLRFFDGSLAISADGRRLAVVITNDTGLFEVWISDMDRPRLTRFAYEPGHDCVPETWTGDGETLFYACRTTDESTLYLRSVDSTDQPQRLMTSKRPAFYQAATLLPDGSALLVNRFLEGKSDVVLLPLEADSDGAPPQQPWIEDAQAGSESISPDGRWLAYRSDVSGRWEVYVRSLRAENRLGREVPISTEGGAIGGWETGGSVQRLTFHHDDEMWSIDVSPDGRISKPKLLGNIGEILRESRFHEHLLDGRILIGMKGEGEDTPDRLNVVLNWTEELKQRMAAQQ